MQNLIAVASGGAMGALARYGLSLFVQRKAGAGLPGAGTLAVNVLGCLVIGLLLGFVVERDGISERTRLFLVMGILGSFTTFSTFGFETVTMARGGQWLGACVNVGLNVILGLGAVVAGQLLARSWAA